MAATFSTRQLSLQQRPQCHQVHCRLSVDVFPASGATLRCGWRQACNPGQQTRLGFMQAGNAGFRAEETPEESNQRRLRESREVSERVTIVASAEELQEELQKAGSELVVLEISSENVCQTGLDEEPELHWRLDQREAHERNLQACQQIKHAIARTARECPDVRFLEIQIPDDSDGEDLKSQLGVSVLPTIQFFKSGRMLWQQQGHLGMTNQLGEGVLYYGDYAASGIKASEYVTELPGRKALNDYILGSSVDDQLTIVLVSTSDCLPCMRVFPAVLALAKNFVGYARFARFMPRSTNADDVALMKELDILEVPTFIFMRRGREVDRLVSGSRGDVIGKLLELQAAAGVAPPPPPPRATVRARSGSRRSSR